MRWVLERLPLAVALAVTVFALLEFEIRDDPKLPLIHTWLSPADAKLVAKALLLVLTFVVAYVFAVIIWRSLLSATPTRLKGPLGFELDWTPEDAKDLREVDERQQEDIKKLAKLVRELAGKVSKLEKRK